MELPLTALTNDIIKEGNCLNYNTNTQYNFIDNKYTDSSSMNDNTDKDSADKDTSVTVEPGNTRLYI